MEQRFKMRMVDIIAKKKSGNVNTQEEIDFITKDSDVLVVLGKDEDLEKLKKL